MNELFGEKMTWILIIALAALPQFVFLSSYINNDIISIMGASVVLFSWVKGLKYDWNVRYSVYLAIGISIILGSYYFAYGYVLCSIILFFVCLHLQRADRKHTIKLTSLIVGLVIFLVGWAFIRNLVLYGELLGTKAMAESLKTYGSSEVQPENRLTIQQQGISVSYMIYNMNWAKSVFCSTVGVLGYMDVVVPDWIYATYWWPFIIGVFGFVGSFAQGHGFSVLEQRSDRLMKIVLFAAFLIPVILNIYSSYTRDYQAQGRYSMSALIAFLPMLGLAVDWLKTERSRKLVTGFLIMNFVVVLFFVTITCYIPT